MFKCPKKKRISLYLVAFGAMWLSGCKETAETKPFKPEANYVNMMTDIIFANKIHSKTKYLDRDSTMSSLMSLIEKINNRDKNDFEAYIKSLQNTPEQYQEFLDSVDARLKEIQSGVQTQIDSSRNISPTKKELKDKVK